MKTNLFSVINLFLFFVCLSLTGFSQTHSWQRTNPGGGGAFSTIGASLNGKIYAGSDLSGVYRSQDNGLSWDVLGSEKGLLETHISGLGFSRVNGNIVYFGTENGIYKSSNGGDNVYQVLNGGYITDIEFGTNNPTTGYASYHPEYNSNNGVIYKSINNGQSWAQSSTDLPLGIRILKIVVNPNNVNTVYLLSGDGRFACGDANVFRSTNGGVNWTNITSSLSEILDVAIDPSNTNTIYVTTMNADCSNAFYWSDLVGEIYKSTDDGTTWNTALSDYTGVIWIDANTTNTIRLIDPREPYPWNDRAGTFTSTNGGISFTKTGDVDTWDTFFNHDVFRSYGSSFNGISKTLGEDLSNNNNFFWTNSQWVFGTNDNGTTFQNLFTDQVNTDNWQSRGFDNITMMDMSISHANADIVYLGFFDMGIWRSLDKGESWENCNDDNYSGDWSGFGGNCATILADPARANVVWASQSGNQEGEAPTYLLKNENTGNKNNWNLSNTGLPDNEIMGLSLAINSNPNNRTLYVTGSGNVYKSTDDGMIWIQQKTGGFRFTAVDYFNNNLVYAGGESGLYKSSDAGLTWTIVNHTDLQTNNGTLFWDRDYQGIWDVKTDPNNPNYVYVTVLGNNKGLYKSTDAGATFQKILTDNFMRNIAITPQNSQVLYATSSSAFNAGGYDSNSNGIYYSEDGGTSWITQNQGMAYPFASTVEVDNLENATVFVGSQGTGFQKSAVFATLGIENNLVDDFIGVYPNPFQNKINFTGITSAYSVSVFSNLGQLIDTFSISENQQNIDLKNISNGIYFLVLENKDNKTKVLRKIIKQ